MKPASYWNMLIRSWSPAKDIFMSTLCTVNNSKWIRNKSKMSILFWLFFFLEKIGTTLQNCVILTFPAHRHWEQPICCLSGNLVAFNLYILIFFSNSWAVTPVVQIITARKRFSLNISSFLIGTDGNRCHASLIKTDRYRCHAYFRCTGHASFNSFYRYMGHSLLNKTDKYRHHAYLWYPSLLYWIDHTTFNRLDQTFFNSRDRCTGHTSFNRLDHTSFNRLDHTFFNGHDRYTVHITLNRLDHVPF